ncbi:hypothetical protein V6N11_048034 [Hibiscus sabdariffa]|uniref:Protein kinase domain-containing protein n=1 Tax=Hibiscus sabdariffa TaxID=183260 RepID=A0ABR2NXJ0_9ROSI
MLSESLQKNKYQPCEEIGRGRFGVISRVFCPMTQSSFACKTIDKRLLSDPHRPGMPGERAQDHDPLVPPSQHRANLRHVRDGRHRPAHPRPLPAGHALRPDPAARSVRAQGRFLHAAARAGSCSLSQIGDFGSATWLGELGTVDGLVGTPYYVAPEVVMGRPYNEKVDIWSAGVVLYVMLAGVPPFFGETAEEIFEAVMRGNLRFPSRIFRSVSAEAKDLLRKMICRDVSRRFSAEQVLRHPWILNGGQTNSMD